MQTKGLVSYRRPTMGALRPVLSTRSHPSAFMLLAKFKLLVSYVGHILKGFKVPVQNTDNLWNGESFI